jgi:hypothetical protein
MRGLDAKNGQPVAGSVMIRSGGRNVALVFAFIAVAA